MLMLMVNPLVASADESGGIGYPTVAAALEALRARSDVSISVQGGWTIVNDNAANTIWSFTPANHPANPAAIKRAIVSHDGKISVQMTALCQAGKAECDKLMEEFKVMNARMSEAMQGKAANTQPAAASVQAGDASWQPAKAQVERVEALSTSYFAAKDGHRYRDAYQMLSPEQQKMTSFERWNALADDFNSKAGSNLSREIKKITWYNNPPQAAPGIYAAVDFSSRFTNIDIHCGYVVWRAQTDGSFLLVREEQNFIDKSTEQKMKPDEVDKVRAQYRCRV